MTISAEMRIKQERKYKFACTKTQEMTIVQTNNAISNNLYVLYYLHS